MTLKEYLEDYASDSTKNIGDELIQKELHTLSNEKIDQGILDRSKYLITEFTMVILQMRKLRLFGRKMELMYITSCLASLQQILQN